MVWDIRYPLKALQNIESILVQRRLFPEISANTVIAWRRNIPYSQAVKRFIEEINAFEA